MGANPASVAMIERLVAFDTTSRNSNLALIEWVRDYLDGLGVASTLTFDKTGDAPGSKANLFATIGPQDKGGIVLSGHTDVVPVDGQDWNSDPFRVIEQDGRLFGRGTCDMKSFLAAALTLAPRFKAAGLKTPIHFAFSYDEEVGCVGVRGLLDELARRPVKPIACIIGEPTGMKILNGQKGKKSMRCRVHGHECHSALAHQGVNAVEAAAEMIVFLRRMGQRIAAHGPFDAGFDPPYTTVHTGLVQGGTALNIVPKECEFEFEFRPLPGCDADALSAELETFAATTLLPPMQAVAPEAAIAFETSSEFPAVLTPEDAEITQLVKQLTGENAVAKASFGTEAGLFQMYGIPAIICGPGSIDQAHKPNEFITLDQVARCEQMLERLLERLQ